MFKKILIPTDGSELSRRAASRAIEFAKQIQAEVIGFYVTEPYPIVSLGEAIAMVPISPEEFSRLARSQAQESLGYIEAAAKNEGVACTTEFTESDQPYDAIIKAAKKLNCDLIFMASHGRRGLSALVLGSETHKVLTHSKIPVLVFR